MKIRLKRAYEPAARGDGCRILVDRVWPRGVTKEEAALDGWFRELAPSSALRKWFGHDPKKWAEFQRRYRKELDGNEGKARQLFDALGKGTVTLVYGARDEEHNQAVAMKAWLEDR